MRDRLCWHSVSLERLTEEGRAADEPEPEAEDSSKKKRRRRRRASPTSSRCKTRVGGHDPFNRRHGVNR